VTTDVHYRLTWLIVSHSHHPIGGIRVASVILLTVKPHPNDDSPAVVGHHRYGLAGKETGLFRL
jgi:hypothetical protein